MPEHLRVATWNLNHWRQPLLPTDTRGAAWAYLADTMHAQVALVQEAVPPARLTSARAAYTEIAGHRNWGSAVVALDSKVEIEPIHSVRGPWSKRRFVLDATHPGSVAVARVTLPGIQPLTCVSVYGVLDGSALGSMHRVVADLLPLFDSVDGARVILAGDFNVTRSSADTAYVAKAEALFSAIRALGLVEVKTLVDPPPPPTAKCACGVGETCGHIATWGDSELDHLFVSPALASQVRALSVDASVIEAGLSDHLPLMLDLELTAELTPHVWDEEAFAIEIGRRHGPKARQVIEALTNWAEQKERELATAAGVTAKVLTRFPTNGVTAEPELMFPVDTRSEPRGSQPMISIHANGNVVIWLGGLRQPPFDTPDARHDLWRLLNEMNGVDLPASQVSGWPRFPLALLQEPANLMKLVAVMDKIAIETYVRPLAEPALEPIAE